MVASQRLHLCGGGVSGILYYLGALVSQKTPPSSLSAESAGAVAAVAWANDVTVQQITGAMDKEALKGVPGFGNVRAPFERMLHTLLPGTCAEMLHEKNIGILVCVPTGWWLPFTGKLKVVTSFRDKEHVVETVLSSCHVPWMMNGRRVSPQGFIDGSLSSKPQLDGFRARADRVICMPTPPLHIRGVYEWKNKEQCLKLYAKGIIAGSASSV